MDTPLITVIVPVYQMQDYLQCCVSSILRQTLEHFELLLIDDGSTDGSAAICDQYAASDPRVRVLHTENAGLSCARNTGLRNAGGELISFVDADDWVDEGYLAALYNALDRGKAAISACNHWIVPDSGTPRSRFPIDGKRCELSVREAYEGVLYHCVPDVSAWGKLYRREVFKGIRYPDGHVFEDTYRIAELLQNAGGVSYCPDVLYHYRFRGDSISKKLSTARMHDFIAAVDHMTGIILSGCPELLRGCERRKMHALLSVRRFYIDCDSKNAAERNALNRQIRRGSWPVLTDRHAPLRDKIGIAAAFAGHRVFDLLWKRYSKARW